MRHNVLTQKQIDDITAAIYNDDNQALYKSLPSVVEETVTISNNAQALAQGQPYVEIPNTNFLVRKDGRVFNTKFVRTIKPMWTPHHFIIHLRHTTVTFKELYEQMGWEYDHDELTRAYKNNEWQVVANKQYRIVYNQIDCEVNS